jgi:hypothetical protein
MTLNFLRTVPKFALAAAFALGAGSSIIATQAANPGDATAKADLFASTAIPASAQDRYRDGYVDGGYRGGWHHGRRWAHRRWHAGYWGPARVWRPGFWVYF